MDDSMGLAQRLARRLGEVEGVEAVVLGGSRARREARPDSDVDLGVYYRPGNAPSVDALRRLAREVDDRRLPDLVTGFGEWGPWINGGGWLRVGGQPVDWLYRDVDRVTRVVGECRAGRPTYHYQPGRPHGFFSHIYAGEIHYCKVLHDPRGTLATLKALTADYPEPLKRALVRHFLWEADFALRTCRKPARRGESFYASGCLFRCVACLVQALFALNKRYFVNEKGSVEAAASFALCPDGFAKTVSSVLSYPGEEPEALTTSVQRLQELTQAVKEVSAEGTNPHV